MNGMFAQFTVPLIFFGAFAVCCGVFLAIIARVFHTDSDPAVEAVNEILPQANCGACGYAGCKAYAEAVVHVREVPCTLCKVGRLRCAQEIAQLTGKKIQAQERT
jgi:electron transport complex protein RnfB